jgi:undecaprenyl diphosphate synthase
MENRIPQHVSIIMDGNGRWAKARGKERIFGHREGAESIRACIEAARDAGIHYISFYAFSEENWARPKEEVDALMQLLVDFIRKETNTFIKNRIRCLVLGNRSRLDPAINRMISEMEAKTAPGSQYTVIVFLSYSGRWDIVQAAKRVAKELGPDAIDNLTQEDFSNYLSTAGIPDPDLLIRTSGEERISNYLLWQSAYTEFYFTSTLWPDFRRDAFNEALAAYAQRDRRYGKVK